MRSPGALVTRGLLTLGAVPSADARRDRSRPPADRRGRSERCSEEGGNAVDALLAAAFTAFVTEGPLTGPAGGGFLLRPRAERGDDAPRLLLRRSGRAPRRAWTRCSSTSRTRARRSSTSATDRSRCPDLLAGLEEAHRRFATRPWAELVEPALELARSRASRATSRARSCTGSSRRSCSATRAAAASTAIPARVVTDDLCATLERIRDVGAAAVAELLPELERAISTAYEVVAVSAARDDGARAPRARRADALARRRNRRRDPRAPRRGGEPVRSRTRRGRSGSPTAPRAPGC